MTWVKIDDKAPRHRKQLRAGAEACWLWVCGLAYAKEQPQHDGFLPSEALRILYPFDALDTLVARLVDAGLWETAPGGYQIHDWSDWNGTAEELEASRAAARERAAKSYSKRRSNSAAQNERRIAADSAQSSRRTSAESPQTQRRNGAALPKLCGVSSGSIPSPIPNPNPSPDPIPENPGSPPPTPSEPPGVRCPPDLALPPEAYAQLEQVGYKRDLIDRATFELRLRWVSDRKVKTPEAWGAYLRACVNTMLSDSAQRRKLREAINSGTDDEPEKPRRYPTVEEVLAEQRAKGYIR